ncbi:MAG: substrate-binding domain-containing protein [Candidatus Elarobacter sp.]
MSFYGAGSLRGATTAIARVYERDTAIPVELHFGSSGRLEREIERGRIRPDIFASADLASPRRLVARHLARRVVPYVHNALRAVARKSWTTPGMRRPVELNAEYGFTVPNCAANAPGGDAFGAFLRTPAAQAIFARFGFAGSRMLHESASTIAG